MTAITVIVKLGDARSPRVIARTSSPIPAQKPIVPLQIDAPHRRNALPIMSAAVVVRNPAGLPNLVLLTTILARTILPPV